jgi:hypothetical protein
MAKYDLTGSLEKDFTFSINGSEYIFVNQPFVRCVSLLKSLR